MSQHDDMGKLINNFGNQAIRDLENLYYNGTHELECPHCKAKNHISFDGGKGTCPTCDKEIILPKI